MKKLLHLFQETFKDWNDDKAPRLAAALSYYTIFSLAPLLVLVIAITGFIVGNNTTIQNQVLTQVQTLVGAKGADIVKTLITNASQPRSGILATVIGIVTLVLGATGVFGQLQDALNTIWEVAPKKNRGIMAVVKDRILTFAMILVISFLLLVSLVLSAALSVLNHYFASLFGAAGIIAQVLNFVISLAVVTFIFAMIFKVLPDVEIKWKDVWFGAAVTAFLFLIGQFLLSFYLSTAAPTSAYGAAGSLIVLLLWVYYSAQILFIGAEFTQVYARETGSQITPNKNARPLSQEERTNQGIPRREGTPARASAVDTSSVQQAMMPVTGQPQLHAEPVRERIRYEPPNPNTVIPVIAVGVVAGIVTIGRIIRQFVSYD